MRNSSAITRDLNGSNCDRVQEKNSLTVNLFLRYSAGVDRSLQIMAALLECFRLSGCRCSMRHAAVAKRPRHLRPPSLYVGIRENLA